MAQLVALALIPLLLSGCGFHLRGSVTLPPVMAVTYIQDSRPATRISSKLGYALRKHDITVTDQIDSPLPDSAAATAILVLSGERFNQRLLSSGSSTLVKEFQLNYSITFELKDPDGKSLLARQTVHTSREQTFNETQVLAKSSEQETLQQEMMADAVRQILRRLQAATQS